MVDKVEDEVKLPTKEELLNIIEGESQTEETQEVAEAPVLTEREQQASNFGWMPKDAWVEKGGDPEDWRPAKDFLDRGEMIGKIRSLTKENQENQKAIKHIVAQQQQVYKNGYQAAITELKAERKAALADGDLLKADDIGDKIEATKAELAKVVTQQEAPKSQQVDPEHTTWVQQNQWYANSKVMMKFADALAVEFVRENDGNVTPEQVRQYVTATVKEEFKHRFQKAQVVAAPNPDSSGQSVTRSAAVKGSTSNLSKIEADMPEEHRQIMKTMLKADPDFKKEDYLKMYNAGR